MPKIVMTLLVRNEQDIIAENILFHHRQGVDQFIIMNNLSTDATVEIISSLSCSIPIELIHQEDDTYDQAKWVTSMARSAAIKYNADWVINNDADEFWMFPGLDAKNYLLQFSADVVGVVLQRHNAVLIRGETWDGFAAHPCSTTLFEGKSLNQLGSVLPGKCLHRATSQITVEQGNHSIRGVKGSIFNCDRALVLHFPYRTFQHYQAKIRAGGAAYSRNSTLPQNLGRTWREQYKIVDQPEIYNFWDGLYLSRQRCIRGEVRGDLFREVRLSIELCKLLDDWRQNQVIGSAEPLYVTTTALVREYLARPESVVGDMERPDPRSLHYNNLPFLAQGPLQHQKNLSNWLDNLKGGDALSRFTELRNLISLFPRNHALVEWLASALKIIKPHAARRLYQYCSGQNIIVHVSCQSRLDRSRASARHFLSSGHRSLIVVGGGLGYPESIDFSFDGEILELPVPDDYEHLGTKVFFAYMILSLLGNPVSVVKVDDDIGLNDPQRFSDLLNKLHSRNEQYLGKLIRVKYQDQCHGWHLGKCADPSMHLRGYQYPMPNVYASGGFGYFLGSEMLRACALMYLSMQSFFEMNCIQLEDVFVGWAAQIFSISAATFEDNTYVDEGLGLYPDVAYAVLPGLDRSRDSF